jgi:hypothetical protein
MAPATGPRRIYRGYTSGFDAAAQHALEHATEVIALPEAVMPVL